MSHGTQRRGRDVTVRRGGEMWPFQGHCTEVIFIDCSSTEGTHEVTCTEAEVNSNLSVIATAVVFLG